jgi:hypothetical protein
LLFSRQLEDTLAVQIKFLLVAVFVAIYFLADRLQFPIQKDELHFWPSALSFSHTFIPSIESLRSYNDLNTPLPFLVFGWAEYFFSKGIWAGRLINLLLSFGICWLFIPSTVDKATDPRVLFALVGLFLCPYFFLSATHLYTEAIAIFFALLGMRLHECKWFGLAAVCFVLAISSRQYMVAFPCGLAIFWIGSKARNPTTPPPIAALIWPSASIFSLVAWIWFFGGPAPQIALESQAVSTAQTSVFLPQNAGYFLACIGAYFCVPQLLWNRRLFKAETTESIKAMIGVCLVMAIWFWFFPPLRNPESYPFAQMGYLDKLLNAALGPAKVGAFYGLAVLTLLCFRSWSLASCLLFAHLPLMMKAHIAWDKYALPLLCFLWWQSAWLGRGSQLQGLLFRQVVTSGKPPLD